MKFLPIIIMLLIISGGAFYVIFRLSTLVPGPSPARTAIVATSITFISFMFISMLFGRFMPVAVTSVMYRIGSATFMIFVYLLIVFLLMDIIRATGLLNMRAVMFNNWTTFGILTAMMAIIFVSGFVRYHIKDKVELPIAVSKTISVSQSDELSGENRLHDNLKIVVVSDLHLGYGIGNRELKRWIREINEMNPDIVLIVGDLIDNSIHPVMKREMWRPFLDLKTTYGIYACTGNHEYISGVTGSEEFYRKAGISLLRDTTALVNDMLYIVGRDDRSNTNRKSLNELIAYLDVSKPMVVMDHQPAHLEEASEAGIDLQISGHTHKGQIWPLSMATKAIYEKDHGYLKKGDTHYYVSSGLGIWGGKFRIGSRSEYVIITLKGFE